MRKSIFVFIAVLATAISMNAQVYKGARTAVSFYSSTPLEDITAKDTVATVILNGKSGDVLVTVPMKGFVFANSLMQEHFNENYMETDKAGPKDANGKVTYPNQKATFKGKINEAVDYTKDGTTKVTITGTLTIHGVAKPRTIDATLIVKGSTVTVDTKFQVALVDHNIAVPTAVGAKIAEKIDVTIHSELINASKK
ncbi:MAG: YceI family protein [Bacteroidia bacterium]